MNHLYILSTKLIAQNNIRFAARSVLDIDGGTLLSR